MDNRKKRNYLDVFTGTRVDFDPHAIFSIVLNFRERLEASLKKTKIRISGSFLTSVFKFIYFLFRKPCYFRNKRNIQFFLQHF